jgi:hypothetical protein
MNEQERATIHAIRQRLGRHVVVVFRKGGRIAEERRYDSEGDSLEEVMGVELAIGILAHKKPIGIDLIGQGWIGVLPWDLERFQKREFNQAEKFQTSCPVRVADVVENAQTGITTIYLESV